MNVERYQKLSEITGVSAQTLSRKCCHRKAKRKHGKNLFRKTCKIKRMSSTATAAGIVAIMLGRKALFFDDERPRSKLMRIECL